VDLIIFQQTTARQSHRGIKRKLLCKYYWFQYRG